MLNLYLCTSIFFKREFPIKNICNIIGQIEVSHAYLGRANIETMVCIQKHVNNM